MKRRTQAWQAGLAVLVLTLTGCIEVTVPTTEAADGDQAGAASSTSSPKATSSKRPTSPTATSSPGGSGTATSTSAPAPADEDGNRSADATPGDAWPVEWGPESAPVRPGVAMEGGCTMNFLFFDNRTDGRTSYYMGTAGHCTAEVGDRLAVAGQGEIGTVVFDSDVTGGADPTVDFTLVLLDEGRNLDANPRMVNHDGPVGAVVSSDLAVGDEVLLHGYGLVLGSTEATRDRSGVLVDHSDTMYVADMPAVNGDSGSPLLHGPTGKALGIVSHYGIGAVPPSTDEGPLIGFILDECARAGFPVSLATT